VEAHHVAGLFNMSQIIYQWSLGFNSGAVVFCSDSRCSN
jgi:hypothetical protein